MIYELTDEMFEDLLIKHKESGSTLKKFCNDNNLDYKKFCNRKGQRDRKKRSMSGFSPIKIIPVQKSEIDESKILITFKKITLTLPAAYPIEDLLLIIYGRER